MIGTEISQPSPDATNSSPGARYLLPGTQSIKIDTAFVVLLGALTMLPPLSIDVSLPGLPVIAQALHSPGGIIQWTLSAFVLAFGGGQLALGPLSDRYGRRPVLLCGLTAFTLLAIACATVTNVYVLVALRFAQGLSACAGTVCARAIVADVARDRTRATSLQAYVSATNALAPIVAPLLGIALLALLDWHWLYGVLALVGIALIAATAARLNETAPMSSLGVLAGYRRMLALPRTLPLATLIFCAFAGYFALISASSLVMETQMHVSGTVFAAAFAINACATMAGSFVAARFAAKIGPERLLGIGATFLLLAGVAVFVTNAFLPSPGAFTATMAAFAFGYGLTVPGAIAAALAEAGADAGAGSAILGCAQMMGGALGSTVAGALPFTPSMSVGIVVALAALGALVATLRGQAVEPISQVT